MTNEEPHRRGRPRDQQSRAAILSAAFELVASENQQAFTMSGIAARAGVSKQTAYRWWPTKNDVILETLADQAQTMISTEDRGSYVDDLRAFLRETFELLNAPGVANALRSLMAESQSDSELKERFRQNFLTRRRAALGELVRRAETRGDLPEAIRGELIGDVVFGVTWYRMLATPRDLDAADAEALAALLSG